MPFYGKKKAALKNKKQNQLQIKFGKFSHKLLADNGPGGHVNCTLVCCEKVKSKRLAIKHFIRMFCGFGTFSTDNRHRRTLSLLFTIILQMVTIL